MDQPISTNQIQAWSSLTTGNTGQVVSKKPAVLYMIDTYNINAAVRYLKIYDKATAATAADPVVLRVPMVGIRPPIVFPDGMKFHNGISVRVVTEQADAGTTDPSVNETVVNLALKTSGG